MRLALGCKFWTLTMITTLALGCGSSGSGRKNTGGTGGDDSTDTGGTGGSTSTGGKGGTGGTAGKGGTGGDIGGSGGDSGGSGGSAGSDADASVDVDAAADDGAVADAETPVDLAPDAPPPVYEMPKAPWLGREIGTPGMTPGGFLLSTTANAGQNIDLVSNAAGIGGTADAFYFLYQPMTGEGVVQGRVVSLATTTMTSAGGLMIRESLDPGSPMVFIGAVGDGSGGQVIVRSAKGEGATTVPMTGTLASLKAANGTMLRMVRTGATVKIYAGAPAAIETDVALVSGGMATLTLTTPNAPLYYGAAVASGEGMTQTRARFNELAIHNLASNASTVNFTHYALGTSGASAVWNGNRLSMTAFGQPWGAVMGTSRDFLGFAYLRNNDSTSVRILVTSETMSDPGSRVAVAIRDVSTLGRSVATLALSLTQGQGLVLEHREMSSDNSELVKVATKGATTAPLWLRLDRSVVVRPGDPLGTSDTYVTAYYTTDNNGNPRNPWTLIGNSFLFPATNANPPAIGIGVASFAPQVLHQVEISKVQVVAAPPPPDGGILPDASPDAGAEDAATDASTD